MKDHSLDDMIKTHHLFEELNIVEWTSNPRPYGAIFDASISDKVGSFLPSYEGHFNAMKGEKSPKFRLLQNGKGNGRGEAEGEEEKKRSSFPSLFFRAGYEAKTKSKKEKKGMTAADSQNDSVHDRRIAFSAEPQIGKTGAYLQLLNLRALLLPSPALPLSPENNTNNTVKFGVPASIFDLDNKHFLLPYWKDVERQQKGFKDSIMFGKCVFSSMI